MAKRWYVIQAFSGFESSVKRSLLERIGRSNLQDYFGEVMVPTEEVVDQINARYAEGVMSGRLGEKELRRLGLPEFWRANGFPSMCRPLGEEDFECD